MNITIYACIITALFIGASFFIYKLWKGKPKGDVLQQLKLIDKLNAEIKTLVKENNKLKANRKELENESKNNFNTDIGKSVMDDIAARR